MLKNQFVCGYHNIANEHYAGASGKHQVDGNAVDTSNGAGPHNIQIFVLSADGIVLTCLPGYWHSQDLADELKLAQTLNQVCDRSESIALAERCIPPNAARSHRSTLASGKKSQQDAGL